MNFVEVREIEEQAIATMLAELKEAGEHGWWFEIGPEGARLLMAYIERLESKRDAAV